MKTLDSIVEYWGSRWWHLLLWLAVLFALYLIVPLMLPNWDPGPSQNGENYG